MSACRYSSGGTSHRHSGQDCPVWTGRRRVGDPKLGPKVWVGVCEPGRWQDWYVQCWEVGKQGKGGTSRHLESRFVDGRAGG